MDRTVFRSYPNPSGKIRRDPDKPTVRVILRRSGLSPDLILKTIPETQTTTRSLIHNSLQQIRHQECRVFSNHLSGFRVEIRQHVTILILYFRYHHRHIIHTLIRVYRERTDHLFHGNLGRSQENSRNRVYITRDPHSMSHLHDCLRGKLLQYPAGNIIHRICQSPFQSHHLTFPFIRGIARCPGRPVRQNKRLLHVQHLITRSQSLLHRQRVKNRFDC